MLLYPGFPFVYRTSYHSNFYSFLYLFLHLQNDDGNFRMIKAVALSIRSAIELSITLTLKHKQDFDIVVGFKD
ncbi:hypothetical protein RSOLAG22IIIB_06111 [Rhizoctonia solani]|uniref:Uncharacterized protein n=1 Tax=Rhizoctonia solani TaxID=456999 RepID=A0A0K6GCA6_9AGAM|nr:hypothetical protein RSOLAG22IIIB_06111 [Rhizoctonia solani]